MIGTWIARYTSSKCDTIKHMTLGTSIAIKVTPHLALTISDFELGLFFAAFDKLDC